VFRAKQLRNAGKALGCVFKINLRSTLLQSQTQALTPTTASGLSFPPLDLHIRGFVLDHVIIKRTLVHSSSLCPELKDMGYY
jgi:hypothetical protein